MVVYWAAGKAGRSAVETDLLMVVRKAGQMVEGSVSRMEVASVDWSVIWKEQTTAGTKVQWMDALAAGSLDTS